MTIAQEWHHVLFLHWPVDAGALRPLIPEPLEIETREGSAWITVLPFAMRRLRLRGLPALPSLSSFPQLNVRTYVALDDRPGVFLLRVAVGSRLAVRLARRLFHLPYDRTRVKSKAAGHRRSRTTRGDRRRLSGCRGGPPRNLRSGPQGEGEGPTDPRSARLSRTRARRGAAGGSCPGASRRGRRRTGAVRAPPARCPRSGSRLAGEPPSRRPGGPPTTRGPCGGAKRPRGPRPRRGGRPRAARRPSAGRGASRRK